jgi:hypothetical protein
MKVWVIELREQSDIPGYGDTVVMHVASSEEKARQWCVDNVDALLETDNNSWFAIATEEVDGGIAQDHNMIYYGRNGKQLEEQPIQ